MADNNKVTIDAAYFNHLFTRAVERERLWIDREGLILECEKIAKERDELKAANEDLKSRVVSDTKRKHFAKLEDEYIAASKERDELKAKLDCADVDRETYKDRAEAAERCIEEIWNLFSPKEQERYECKELDIIRAYRGKKEAAK